MPLVHIHEDGPEADVYHHICPQELPEGVRYVSKEDAPAPDAPALTDFILSLTGGSPGGSDRLSQLLDWFSKTLRAADKS